MTVLAVEKVLTVVILFTLWKVKFFYDKIKSNQVSDSSSSSKGSDSIVSVTAMAVLTVKQNGNLVIT